MENTTARRRPRTRASRRTIDAYMISLVTVAASCSAVAVAVIVSGPEWSSLILDVPLGAWLLGWLGGLVTVGSSPSWARRLGSRYPGRVVGLTCYRLAAAAALGAIGWSLATAISERGGLVFPGWFLMLAALVFGLLERYVNEAVLRAFGVIAPREIDPRLL